MVKITDGYYKGLIGLDMGVTKKGNPVIYNNKLGLIYCAPGQVEKLD